MHGLAAILTLLCLSPVTATLLPLLSAPSESTAAGLALLTTTRLWGLWLKSVAIAVGTVVFTTLLGAPLGLCLHRLAGTRPASLPALLAAPLLLPPHILAVAWIDVLGPHGLVAAWGLPHPTLYSSGGVVLVQALSWYPIPLLTVWLHLRQQDPRIEDAGRTLASGRAVFRYITLPLLYPPLATGALIVFLFSLLSFSVPSLLQVSVYTVEIFSSFNSLLDQRQAVLLAIPLVATGLILGGLLLRVPPTVPPPIQMGSRPGRPHRAARGYAITVTVAVLGLPATALAYRVASPGALWRAWQTGAQEIGTSLLLGSLGATLLLAMTLPLALAYRRTHPAWVMTLALAYLVSGPVLGVGLIACWNHTGLLGMIYDHVTILVIAVVTRYALFAWLGVQLIVRWLPPELSDAARCLGAGRYLRFFRVILPLAGRPLIALWSGLFLLIMGELECIVLVAPPGWVPVSLRIFTLMHYGPTGLVSALALLQGVASLLLLLGVWHLFRRNRVYTPVESRYHNDS